nr:replication-relaxation family protein [Clostridioides sp.]
MITDRDMQILNFLDKVRLATKEQIHELFFNNVSDKVTYRRLNKLSDEDFIKRSYYNLGKNKNVYVYYLDKKPSKKLIKHDLYITDLIAYLIKLQYEIVEFEKSPVIGRVIPDAYIKIRREGKSKNLLLEVQLSNNDCLSKYYNFKDEVLENTNWNIMPRLLILSDLNIKKIELIDIKTIYSDLDMKGLGDLL